MEHHGWEFVVFCLTGLVGTISWPIVVVITVWVFRKEWEKGIRAIHQKFGEIAKVRISKTAVTAEFKRENISLPPMTVENVSAMDMAIDTDQRSEIVK
jgi:hypothetical protein